MRGFLLRFLVIAALLGWGALREAQPLTAALLPLFRTELEHLDNTFRIDRLSIDRDGADQVVRIEVGLGRTVILNGRTFSPNPRGAATASTLVGNVTLPCTLLIAVALAWPGGSGRQWAARILVLPPVVALLCALDAPFILWAALWGLIIQAADPNRFSPLLIWSDFLLNGGSFALAIVLGACVGSLTGRSSSP
jgi:hypothetical protein